MVIAARYDAAQTTEDNSRHWSQADALSAAQSNTAGIRWILRNRSRYEAANNSYLAGIARTIATDTVGAHPPRLQLVGVQDAQRVEQLVADWLQEIDAAGKLQLARMTRLVDGECFGIIFTDRRLAGPVKLNFDIVAAEHFYRNRWSGGRNAADWSDGIEYDAAGRPTKYHFSKTHPNEGGDPRPIDAQYVIHYAHQTRPGQLRGIPETTPALPLFAELRRFTLATLAAAETAADFAAVLQSTAAGDAEGMKPLSTIEIVRRMMTTLPPGYQLAQLKAEHPTTNHEMFLRSILQEIARSFGMPYMIAAGNSSGYNYSSGRLDLQAYFRQTQAERAAIERQWLRRLLFAWFDEATLIPGILRDRRPFGEYSTRWFWQGWKHQDPVKEANAQAIRLANLTTTLEDEWAEQGEDYRRKLEQIAKERKEAAELGITPAEALPGATVQRTRNRTRRRTNP